MHAAQIIATYRFHDSDRIVASYTRSSAIRELNDFNTYFGNIQNPVLQPNSRGPLNWDALNRYRLRSHSYVARLAVPTASRTARLWEGLR